LNNKKAILFSLNLDQFLNAGQVRLGADPRLFSLNLDQFLNAGHPYISHPRRA